MADVPAGAIQQMKLLMELADLPMYTRKYDDGTVVQIQRADDANLVRVWPGASTEVTSADILYILSLRDGVYSHHVFDLITRVLAVSSGDLASKYTPMATQDVVEGGAVGSSSTPYTFNGKFIVDKVFDSESFPTYQAYTLDGQVIWSRTCSGGGDGAWDWSETYEPLAINGYYYHGLSISHHLIAAKQYYPWRYTYSNVLHSAYSVTVEYDQSDSYDCFMTFKNVGDGNTLRIPYGSFSGIHTWKRILDVAESSYLGGVMDVFPPSAWIPMTLEQFQAENSISFAPKGTGNDSYFNYLAHVPQLDLTFSGTLISENQYTSTSPTPPPWSGIFGTSGVIFIDGNQGSREIHFGGKDKIYDDPRTLPIQPDLTETFRDSDTLEFSFWRRK